MVREKKAGKAAVSWGLLAELQGH